MGLFGLESASILSDRIFKVISRGQKLVDF